MSTLKINDYSEQLLDMVPELKKGQSVTFELISHSVQEMINDDNSRQRIAAFPASQNVPNRDTIKDPFANNGKGDLIDIGYVTAQGTRNSDPQFGTILILGSKGGRLTLTSDAKDLALYRYLMLTNFNENSVNPEKSRPATGYIFRTVKPEATAAEKLEIFNKKLQAAAALTHLTEDEIRELARTFGLDSTRSEAEIMLDLNEMIQKDIRVAKTVTNLEHTTAIQMNVLLEDAQKNKVIAYNSEENEWNWVATGKKIIGQFAGDALDELKAYMVSTDAGEKFHDNLRKAVADSGKGKKK